MKNGFLAEATLSNYLYPAYWSAENLRPNHLYPAYWSAELESLNSFPNYLDYMRHISKSQYFNSIFTDGGDIMANGQGGARIGAGRKKKALADNIADGNPGKRNRVSAADLQKRLSRLPH